MTDFDWDGYAALDGLDGLDGFNERLRDLLETVRAWFSDYVAVTNLGDLDLLALWTVHTYVCPQTWSTPRLIIDSITPGSGKTTVLEHLKHLCHAPISAAALTSAALLARVFKDGPRTLLIDEVHRTLSPTNPNLNDLIAILNSGYKPGGERPVLTPTGKGAWEPEMMPTFGPVAMAGNAPQLPDDTRQRSIRILLMPDSEGTIQESDWEEIEPRAADLQALIAEVMESARDSIKQHKPIVPADCKGRMKEKWGPLARIAQVAGGDWPKKVEDLIMDDLEEQRLEREDGIEKRPAGVVLLDDLARIWPEESRFVRTPDLIRYLISCRPDYWGESSSFGKALTSQRLGRLLTQAAKIHSTKLDGARGYTKESFAYVWRRMGITPGKQTVQTVHTVQTDSPSDLFADGPDAA